jgi:hypothetical protein
MIAALTGGIVSCLLLWPYGAIVALVGVPFGGSLAALLAAGLVCMRTSDGAKTSEDRSSDLDEIGKLRSVERR